VAFFSTLKRSPWVSTAQIEERVSPPTPTSEVAEARRSWRSEICTSSSRNTGALWPKRTIEATWIWCIA
jgi:hypothetical protein